jgi:hypothetical protein
MENIKEQFARLYAELDLTDDQFAMLRKLQRDVEAALRQPLVSRSYDEPDWVRECGCGQMSCVICHG